MFLRCSTGLRKPNEILIRDPLYQRMYVSTAAMNYSMLVDTNDLERALRVIPMGRKNWLFCTTETGAKHLATIQTLLATCRAQGIDAYPAWSMCCSGSTSTRPIEWLN